MRLPPKLTDDRYDRLRRLYLVVSGLQKRCQVVFETSIARKTCEGAVFAVPVMSALADEYGRRPITLTAMTVSDQPRLRALIAYALIWAFNIRFARMQQ
ncbi:hypothetical protein KIN20_020482 [Parelaphostrongylus tenuis]|uniref:Uncharacterized protein n=1 Tax=Parelaphostrongylus tenuis TaxID=148309 RepID=A0AAD5N466_PARTN|nr:hypothetical protein KIN20_020482 [Parelaphostrongylus tenuis]